MRELIGPRVSVCSRLVLVWCILLLWSTGPFYAAATSGGERKSTTSFRRRQQLLPRHQQQCVKFQGCLSMNSYTFNIFAFHSSTLFLLCAASVGLTVSRRWDRSSSAHSHASPAWQPQSIPSCVAAAGHVSTHDTDTTFWMRRQCPW